MLKARVITALCLLVGFLSALFFLSSWAWLALAVVIAAVGAWEWGGMMAWTGAVRGIFPVVVGGAVAALGILTGLDLDTPARHPALLGIYLAGGVFWMVCVPLWLSRKWRIQGSAWGGWVGLLVLVPASLVLAHARQISPWFLLACMAAVWLADIGAYFVGRAWGRRKLAPTISPGKSWEGAAGGALSVLVYGLFLLAKQGEWVTGMAGYGLAALALLVFVAVSIEGDLFESLLKRQAGIKDSGRILPGHGGVLDRIDSLTSTLPFVGLAILYHFMGY